MIVVGLILGGTLIGKELIDAARVRKAVSYIESINLATRTFQDKFACYPGDCSDAESQGLGSAGAAGENGDGDGRIGSLNGNLRDMLDYAGSWEPANFWYHLLRANFISDAVSGWHSSNWSNAPEPAPYFTFLPATNEGGVTARIYIAYNVLEIIPGVSWPGHSYIIAGYNGSGPIDSDGGAAFLPHQTYAIDLKIDDGLPLSGNMLAGGDQIFRSAAMAFDAVQGSASAGDDACVSVDSTPMAYNVRNFNRNAINMCTPLIRSGF